MTFATTLEAFAFVVVVTFAFAFVVVIAFATTLAKLTFTLTFVLVFDIELTSFSTFILLASSLFMALAVSAIHKGNLNSTRWMLFGTIIFGAIFLACQVYEFTHFVHAPGNELTLSSYRGQPHVFGSTFYVLTGTHGTHVAIGVFWLLGWLAYSFTGKMSTADAMDIECCGLYWHFVDIVWIIIFPVIYLMEYALI